MSVIAASFDRWRIVVVFCLLVSLCANLRGQQSPVKSSEFVFTKAKFPQCHASTIAIGKQGLVCAWFGGTREKHADVGIWVSRQVGADWTPPVEVANGVQYLRQDGTAHRHPCWNPVLFQPRRGPLLLFYKCGPSPSSWWGMLTRSTDGGKTWSEPQRLPEQIDGPVKNKPIELADGTILCGSSTEYSGWRLHLERTKDLGATWTRSTALNDGKSSGAIQPSLLTYSDGRLQMLCRNRDGQGDLWQTWSSDGGKTWTKLAATGLPNPNSGTDAVTLADGRQLLVYNHTNRRPGPRTAHHPNNRGMLNVAFSNDGKTWHAGVVLESEQRQEFSYPAVIQDDQGMVHITYTWKRQRIKHIVLDPKLLMSAGKIEQGRWPK